MAAAGCAMTSTPIIGQGQGRLSLVTPSVHLIGSASHELHDLCVTPVGSRSGYGRSQSSHLLTGDVSEVSLVRSVEVTVL